MCEALYWTQETGAPGLDPALRAPRYQTYLGRQPSRVMESTSQNAQLDELQNISVISREKLFQFQYTWTFCDLFSLSTIIFNFNDIWGQEHRYLFIALNI